MKKLNISNYLLKNKLNNKNTIESIHEWEMNPQRCLNFENDWLLDRFTCEMISNLYMVKYFEQKEFSDKNMHFNQKIDDYRAPKCAILHPFLLLNDFTTILSFTKSLEIETNAVKATESEITIK